MADPVSYPATLPRPVKAQHQPKVRFSGSDLPGKQAFSSRQRDYSGTVAVEFFFTSAQAEQFYTWWRDTLLEGGLWFNAVWPDMRSGFQVYCFVSPPEFRHVYDGAYRVSATVMARGVTEAVVASRVCTDGPQWAESAVVNSRQKYSLAYGNGLFVSGEILAGSATASYSADGNVWVNSPSSISTSGYGLWLTFGGGLFYARTNAITGASSPDGITWTQHSHPSFLATSPPWYGNGWYMKTDGTFPRVQRTQDMVTHEQFNIPFSYRSQSSGVWGDGVHVCAGSSGAVYSLDDGVTWAQANTPVGWSGSIRLYFAQGVFFALRAGQTNVYFYSTNGVDWAQGAFPGAGQAYRSVVYAQGRFLATGHRNFYPNTPYLSTDGISWYASAHELPAFSLAYGLLATDGAGRYVVTSIQSDYTKVAYGIC